METTTTLEKMDEEIKFVQIIPVTDKSSLEQAVAFSKELKAKRKQIEEYWEPVKKQAHETWKSIVGKEKAFLDKIDAYIFEQNKLTNAYVQEQERIRMEAERKARILAEQEAEKERKRLEALAKKEEKKGNEELAESIRLEKENVLPIVQAPIQTAIDQTNGIHARSETVVDVTNLDAFVQALVEKGQSTAMLDVKKAVLKSWVKSNGIKSFPGLTIREEKKAVIR